MTKHYACILLLFLITTLLVGCVSNRTTNTRPTDTFSHIEDSSQLLRFKEIMPDAIITDVLYYDLDANNEDDCIVLFSADNRVTPITAGLSICLSNSLYSSIDLSGNLNLVFNSTASLTHNYDIPTISVQLKDPGSGTIYLYSVEYTYDHATKEANYKIYSEILKGE